VCVLRAFACLLLMSGFAFAQPPAPVRPTEALMDQVPPKPFGQPTMALADHHVHVKGDLTLEDALRRSRETGISYGIAINGGLGFPIDSDAGLEPFLREMEGKPADKAFQAEGREWVRLFSTTTLAKFDYVFTDTIKQEQQSFGVCGATRNARCRPADQPRRFRRRLPVGGLRHDLRWTTSHGGPGPALLPGERPSSPEGVRPLVGGDM